MKKLSKRILLIIIVLVITLSTLKLYSTYATGEGVTPNATYTFNLNDSTTTTVEANSSKLVYYQIKNTNPGTVRYGVGYSSNSSTVYVYSDSDDEASDLINRDDTKIIKLRIENPGNSTDTVEISTVYGYVNGGNLIPPSGVTLVTEKIYTLKFDANGGTINTPSKLVKLNEPYGTLPTPTRDGYTFKGWNGKNKFDESKYVLISNFVEYPNNRGYKAMPIFLEQNKSYKISIVRHNGFNGELDAYLLFDNSPIGNSSWSSIAHKSYPDYSTVNYCYSNLNNGILYLTTICGTYNDSYDMSQEELDYIWTNTDVQLEEGTTATAYEPYYVTSSTIVTERNTDYVLTAIWEEDNS